jgi:uncharacterized protein YjdB
VSIGVTPPNPSIAKGTTQQFTATGIFSDASTQDLTSQVRWASSDLTVSTISNSGLSIANTVGTTAIYASFGTVTGTTVLTITNAVLVSISITPPNPGKAMGTTQQFTATGYFSDSTHQDLTMDSTWTSSDDSIATVSDQTASKGLGYAVDSGFLGSASVTITAAYGGISGTTEFTVTPATLDSISITAAENVMPKGTTQQLTATGIFSDGTTQNITTSALWTSADTGSVSVSNAEETAGIVTALSTGVNVVITASRDGVDGTFSLSVTNAALLSITVTSVNTSLARGLTEAFTAEGHYTDGTHPDLTTQVTWTSSNSNVLMSNAAGTNGQGYAQNIGTSVITATFGAITSNNYSFTVTAATLVSIGVTPATGYSMAQGLTRQYTATGVWTYGAPVNMTNIVTWSSSADTIATVSSGDPGGGMVTADNANTGTTTISASYGTAPVVTGSAVLTVTDATLDYIEVISTTTSTPKGTKVQFSAAGIYSNGDHPDFTDRVTWSSSSDLIATVSNNPGTKGEATAVDPGTATITATDSASGKFASGTLTVTAATLNSIEISSTELSIAKGTTQPLKATAIYSDRTVDITSVAGWTSSDDAIATIDSSGLLTGHLAGTITITATYSTAEPATLTGFTVTAATLSSVAIEAVSSSMPVGRKMQFKATGIFSDASTQIITTSAAWNSSVPEVAEISNASEDYGTATSITTGSTVISAVYGGKTGNFNLTVTDPLLVSITVTPVSPSISKGLNCQFKAIGIYSNSTTQDLTSSVIWSSSGAEATISNTSPFYGLALASSSSTGTTTITATLNQTSPLPNISGSTVLTVTNETLTALSVSPNTKEIVNGSKQQFTVMGFFSNSSTLDMTSLVTWSASPVLSGATISNDPGSKGLYTSGSNGTTTITASYTYGAGPTTITDTASLKVSSPTLESIIITPPNTITIGFGTYQQFKATGVYSNGLTPDITSQVTWSSTVPGVATISPSSGQAISAAAGITTITATLGSKSASTSLTVVALALKSITVTPTNKSFGEKQTQQMTATALYTDDVTTQILTDQVVWSSADDSKAIVSNASGSQGLVTGISAPGTNIAIRAERDGIIGSANVNIIADVERPTVLSADLTGTNTLKITYSEPVDINTATLPGNYKIVLSSDLPTSVICNTDDNNYFSNTPAGIAISSIAILSPNEFELTIGSLTPSNYTVVVNRNAISDLATVPNILGCPNWDEFTGVDTTKPYLVSITNGVSNQLKVTYSENMLSDDTSYSAKNPANYQLSIVSGTGTLPIVSSVSKIPDTQESVSTFLLTLSEGVSSISYKLAVINPNVRDIATPIPNTIGTPNFLTFMGNEQLKVVSAEAIDTKKIKITFNKPVNSGNNTAFSAGCTNTYSSDDPLNGGYQTVVGEDYCSKRYKFNPGLGSIRKAEVGTLDLSNTVTITHSIEQLGQAYTVMVANYSGSGSDTDGFDNSGWGSVMNDSSTERVLPAPKDRATFQGLGSTVKDFKDGTFFEDPFVDGTSFAFAFTYAGKVYLGTNDSNNSAFRFDPSGSNSVLITFASTSSSCANATGFGFGTGTLCATSGLNLQGFNGERGVVGFNSVDVTVGTNNYELLLVGPLKDGVNYGYFTQDLDSELNWTPFTFSVTGGGNTKSIQTLYAFGNHLYLGFSSAHGTQAPIVSHHNLTDDIYGIVSVESGTDMTIRSVPYIGKNAGVNSNTASVVGIDSMISFSNALYMANNGGIMGSTDYTGFSSPFVATPSGFTGTTRQLPAAPGGLEKISAGQKGIPVLMVFNNKLYMVRNVGTVADAKNPLRGEVWKCNITAGSISPAGWTRIISGTETEVGTANSISMFRSNGSGVLYIGFDDPSGSGVRIFRYVGTEPAATGGTMASAGWIQQGTTGLAGSYLKILSSASTAEGIYNFIYVTTVKSTGAIRVFRQID